jgi:hypothetical protein
LADALLPAARGDDDRPDSTGFVVILIEQRAKLGDDVVVILIQPLDFLLLRAKRFVVRRRFCGIERGSIIEGQKPFHRH